jgi:hypothetical protein
MRRYTKILLFISILLLPCVLISSIEAEDGDYFTGSLLSLGSVPMPSGHMHYFTGLTQTRGSLSAPDGNAIVIEPGTLFAGYFVYDASLQDTQEYYQGVGHYSAAPDHPANSETLPAFSLTFQLTQGLLTLKSTGSFEALVDAANPDLHSFWAYWNVQGHDLELRLEDEDVQALRGSHLPNTFALPDWTRADLLIPTGLAGRVEHTDTNPMPLDTLQIVPAPAHIDPSLAWTFPRQEDGTPLNDLAGYRVCCGLNAHVDASACAEPVDIELEPHNLSLQLRGLMPGQTYYCAIQSYDLAGHRSLPSSVASLWTGTY